MKYKVHIPTEQYGFCEVEFDPAEGRHVVDIYREIQEMFKDKEGIDDKRMNAFIDNMLLANGKNHIDVYNQMSEAQKNAVQVLKRGLKRVAPLEDNN